MANKRKSTQEKTPKKKRKTRSMGSLVDSTEHAMEDASPPHPAEHFEAPTSEDIPPTAEPSIIIPDTQEPSVVLRAPRPVTDALKSDTPLIPPLADDASLRKTHDLHVLGISANSKIESKVRQALSLLKERTHAPLVDGNADKGPHRQLLIAFVARAAIANKCVSVVEIVKREFLKENETRLFQYTAVWSQLESYQAQKVDVILGDTLSDELENGKSASKSKADYDRPKVRNVSCLAVYLASQSVTKLKEAYRLVRIAEVDRIFTDSKQRTNRSEEDSNMNEY
jgi:hypothetical protein